VALPRSAELGLSDEQLLLRRTVRQFAQEKVGPRARQLDAEQGFPTESWAEAAALGMLGTTVPIEDGGTGLGLTELCLIGEELAAVCISTAATVLHQADMVVGRIARHGDAAQKRRWLPGLIDGSLIGCLAMTEAEAGSDVMSMRTRAERTADGWRLNGTKTFITNGPVADLALVYARTPESGERSLGLFAVPTEAPGFSRGKKFSKMGWRGSPTGELLLDECEVGPDALLGAPDGGRAILLDGLDSERVLMAAESVGLAQGALEVALAYAGQRRQFGKRIGEFQLVGAKLADMFAETEAARALTRSLAARIDAGESGGLRALASACKLLGGDLAMRVTSEAVQVLGGYGYIDEFPVERYMRDAKLMQIGGGTAEIQRYVIARELLA
jgi:isovaleryl-CoA dehydrogenase